MTVTFAPTRSDSARISNQNTWCEVVRSSGFPVSIVSLFDTIIRHYIKLFVVENNSLYCFHFQIHNWVHVFDPFIVHATSIKLNTCLKPIRKGPVIINTKRSQTTIVIFKWKIDDTD